MNNGESSSSQVNRLESSRRSLSVDDHSEQPFSQKDQEYMPIRSSEVKLSQMRPRRPAPDMTRSLEGPLLQRPAEAQLPRMRRQSTMNPQNQMQMIQLSNESFRFKRQESMTGFNDSKRVQRGINTLTAQAIRKELLFDYQLKEKLAVGDGLGKKDKAEKLHKFQKQWLSRLKTAIVLIYFLILPYLYTPQWCLRYFIDHPELRTSDFVYNCEEVRIDGAAVRYSTLPKLAGWLTALIDLVCLGYLTFYRFYKLSWRKMTKKGRARNYALVVILILSTIDHILGLILKYNAIISLFIRPFVVYIFFSAVRSNLWLIVHSFKDTLMILGTIICYVLFFALVGHYLFRHNFEGIAVFTNLNASYYQLVILLTTANFPDVMLPAYEKHYLYSIYFVVYLVVGLYFLLNILLANVFSMYKTRLELKLEKKTDMRENIVALHFDKFDNGLKGHLEIQEAKKFFAFILNLNYKFSKHQQTFQQIMKHICSQDSDGNVIVTKDQVIEFFLTPGFMELVRIEQVKPDNRPRSPSTVTADSRVTSTQKPNINYSFLPTGSEVSRVTVTTSNDRESSAQRHASSTPLTQITEMNESDPPSPNNAMADISFLEKQTEDTFFNANRASEQVETVSEWRLEWTKRLGNPIYNGILCTLNLLIIVLSFYKDHSYQYSRFELAMYWKKSTVIVNCIFLADLVVNIAVLRIPLIVKQKKHLLIEIILQIACVAAYVQLFGQHQLQQFSSAVGIAMTVYFMRLIRIVEFFSELQQFQVILYTLRKFTTPFVIMSVNLYTLFYTYAYIGEFTWGGRITTKSEQTSDDDIPALYYLMAFNDFGQSMVTLFHVMVVNNWWVTCNMFIDVSHNNWPQLYFASFWVLTVLIIFNLVVSNVIEIYDEVETDVQQNFERRGQIKELMELGHNELTQLVRKTQQETVSQQNSILESQSGEGSLILQGNQVKSTVSIEKQVKQTNKSRLEQDQAALMAANIVKAVGKKSAKRPGDETPLFGSIDAGSEK